MTALTKQEGRPLATTASAECSPVLWQRLTEHQPSLLASVDDLVSDARERNGLLAEMIKVAPRIAGHAEPCGEKAVIAELAPMVVLYGVPDKSEKEWATFWRFYTDALNDLPLAALRAGVKEYIARGDSEFFPKPG